MDDELLYGQAQNRVKFYYKLKFDLEGQGQSFPKTIKILTKVHLWSKFSDSGLNGSQVIVRTSSGLTHGSTNTQTDATNDNTRRPKLASGKKSGIHLWGRFY